MSQMNTSRQADPMVPVEGEEVDEPLSFEELMQDAFLRLLERWERVSAMENPGGYLYRTAINLFHSRRRRLAAALRRPFRPAPATDELAAVEENDAAVRAMAPLSPRQRAGV